MTRRLFMAVMTAFMLVTQSGCPNVEAEDFATLIGFDDDKVFIEYITSGGESGSSRSLFVFDFDTDQSSIIQQELIAYGVQAEGDYYVAEEEKYTEDKSLIVAVQISTGKQINIIEYGYDQFYRLPQFILHGNRVLVLANHQLKLFDLPTETIIKTIDVPNDTEWLGGFKGSQVLVGRGEGYDIKSAMIINLLTDEIINVPSPPGSRQIFAMEDAQLSDTWFALRTSTENTESEDFTPVDILLFDIPTVSWKVLVQNTTTDWENFFAPLQAMYLYGCNSRYLLFQTSVFTVPTFNIQNLLIDVQTGEQHIIYEDDPVNYFFLNYFFPFPGTYLSTQTPQLHNNQVYWIEATSDLLAIYDISTETQRSIPLNLANAD